MKIQDQPNSVAKASKLEDEQARLSALDRYQILDTDYEHEFSNICGLIKSIFRVRYVAINLIDSHRQWSKAFIGGEEVTCRREEAFCDYTIRSHEPLVVEDASIDPRFATLGFVTGEAHIRAYLGVPLTSPDGYNIGALCVFDSEPRAFTEADSEILRNFAKVVMTQMEMRLIGKNDALTGAHSYRKFLDEVDRIVAASPPAPATTLLALDLDHFSAINAQWGHRVGNIVLRRVAEVIRQTMRRSDSLGRMGGEEFALLLHHCDASGAVSFAERLCGEIASTPIPEIGGKPVTLSIGIAERRAGEGRNEWLARANGALYSAKRDGRNRYHRA